MKIITFNQRELNNILRERILIDFSDVLLLDNIIFVFEDKSFKRINKNTNISVALTYIQPWNRDIMDISTITRAIIITNPNQIPKDARRYFKLNNLIFYYKNDYLTLVELLDQTIKSPMFDMLRERLIFIMKQNLNVDYKINIMW